MRINLIVFCVISGCPVRSKCVLLVSYHIVFFNIFMLTSQCFYFYKTCTAKITPKAVKHTLSSWVFMCHHYDNILLQLITHTKHTNPRVVTYTLQCGH